jgi:membrane protease YdiL (CAAX protease family)
MEDSSGIIRQTLTLFFLSLIFFSVYYVILSLFIPYYYLSLHFIATTAFTLLSLFLILIGIKEKTKLYLLFISITILILIEELLLISLYVIYGLIINIFLIIFLPLFANLITKDERLRICLESLALILISRTILVAFPKQFLFLGYSMIIIYAFLIIALVTYLYIRKIPNESIRLFKGNSNLTFQIILGLIVGIGVGTTEYFVLKLKVVIFENLFLVFSYVVFVMILVGFAEEILFRGMLQTYLEKLMPKFHAIFLASVIFGLMHIGWLNPWEVVLAYGAGLIFGLFAYYFNSLVTPITAHFFGNVVLYLIPVFFVS